MRKIEVPSVAAIGTALAAHKLLIAIVVVAILLVLLLVVVVLVTRRKTPQAAASAGPPQPETSSVDTYTLRMAWQRFVGGLPGAYQRSLLNFDHFVVMGAPASGKTRLIDSYSDWKQQTREFSTSQANDPDLPLYLGSSELIMELPGPTLDDQSEAAFQTLNNLWRPIYQERAPTVVVVVDVARLLQAPPHLSTDLAQKMRGKINMLSEIRKRGVEVRVALTHLDELEGYEELTEFCRDHEIPLRVPPPATREPAEIGRGFDAWFDDLRGYLPNALTSLDSAKYRRIVSFLSKTPDISSAVRPFLRALFQYEAAVAEPIYGGVYLASEIAGVSNPIQGALETGPGPNPSRRHLVVAAAVGIIGVGFLGDRFNAQHTRWSAANEALEVYSVADKSEDEPYRRADVVAFTSRHNGWFDRHPDFFGNARHEMRKRFSDRIRQQYLVKGLKSVAEHGTRHHETPMAARRSVYYLGLIHSDKNDKLHILEPGQTEIWASMIELQRDTNFLSDYLTNVDEAWKTPIEFQLPNQGVDPSDGSHEWVELFDDVDKALADGVVSRNELAQLQKETKSLRGRLERFDNDAVMRRVLRDIDLAAGTQIYKDGEPQHPGPLERHYHFKLETFERHVRWAEDPDLRRTLRRVLDWVNAAAIDVALPHTLGDLTFRLEQLYTADNAAPTEDSRITVVKIEGTERRLPSGRWAQIIRDSKAEQYIEGFLSGAVDQSTLFGPDAGTLAPVRWNPNGDGAAVFVGHGVLDGRYTKIAYDTFIRDVVVRLTAVLARAHISNDLRAALNLVVGDQIARYAARYHEEGVRFAQSFDVQGGSQEALRVALAQMSADTSAFNDFLVTLDQNTRLDAPAPLLSSIATEMATFDSWHQAVGGGAGAPEIGKYKAILGQLLVDLGPPAAAGAPEPGPPAAPGALGAPGAPAAGAPPGDTGTETLEKLLTPAGRLYLAWLRGEKGSYSLLVENWLTSIRMPEAQRKPFRAPLRRLAELGRHDIERVLSRMWHVDMLPSLQRIASRFPFDRTATTEASPDELRELFHPKEGRMFDLFRRYVEPISQVSGASPSGASRFHPTPAAAHGLSLPQGLFAAVNASAALSTRLWDQAGNPTPIELRISTVRFERRAQAREGEPDRATALTLMYLNLGEASVFNFNQQPSLVTVGFDWTKDHRSQVGIQLTDTLTKENNFPPPIAARGTYWSFYHLLLRATPSPVRSPPTAQLYTWNVWHQPESAVGEMIPVRFVMVNDPWEPFTGIGHFAPRRRDLPREARRDIPPPPPPRPLPPPLPPPQLREPPRGTM
jgi:hypothetical protein